MTLKINNEILLLVKLPRSFSTVTPLSKALAAILFISFPFVGFYLGIEYQKKITTQSNLLSPFKAPAISPSPIILPSNQPNITPSEVKRQFCGGPEKVSCPSGYVCKSDKDYPDPEGTCVPDSNEIPPKSWDESVCTQDAKMCPDGSSVGRQGPNCEFAKCPGE